MSNVAKLINRRIPAGHERIVDGVKHPDGRDAGYYTLVRHRQTAIYSLLCVDGLRSCPQDWARRQAIIAWREQLAMTQEGLADGLGLTRVTVGQYERGDRPIPSTVDRAVHDLVANR